MTAVDERQEAPANIVPIPTKIPPWQRQYARRLVAVDFVGVVLSVGLAQWLRFGGLPGTTSHQYIDYTVVSIAIAVGWLSVLSINNSRSPRVIGSGVEEYRRVWLATLTVFGGVAIISMLFKLDIARGYLMIALPIGLVLLILFRWIARRLVVWARQKHGRCITRVLVVGNVAAVRDFTKFVARESNSEYEVVGACVPGPSIRTEIEVPGVGSIPTFGDESNVAAAVAASEQPRRRRHRQRATPRAGHPRLVVGTGEARHRPARRAGCRRCRRSAADDAAGRRPAAHPRREAAVPRGQAVPEAPIRHHVLAAVLLFGLPVLVAVAIAVKVTSKGPVFYRSERIGLDGLAVRDDQVPHHGRRRRPTGRRTRRAE